MTFFHKMKKAFFIKFFIKTLTIFLLSINILSAQDQIGVIGFVTGDVFNQKGEKLQVGDSIFFGDTINAAEGAKSQLLFIDETVMTVGAKTELTIEDY